jgi:GGDEF domain-containing protein
MGNISETPETTQLKRIGDGIKDLLFGQGDAAAAAESTGEGTPETAGQATAESVRAQIGTLLSDKEHASVGRLQVLGLGKIRDRLGERWRDVGDRVYATMEKTIKKRLAATDTCVRAGDEGFIILFDQLNREEAEFKCAAIAEEVWEQILGEKEAAEYVEVKTVVVDVDGRALVEEVDPLAHIAGLFSTPQRNPASFTEGSLSAGAHEKSRTLEGSWLADVAAAESDILSSVRCTYRPIWDVHRNALLTFQCEPVFGSHARASRLDGKLVQWGAQRAEILQFDQLTLCDVANVMRRLAQINRRFLLSCCVHYETLSRVSSRTVHAALCREVPESYRKYVVFELLNVPECLPRIRLDDILSGLRMHSRTIRCRVDLDWVGFDKFRGAGIDAFGVDLSDIELPERQLLSELDAFCKRVRQAGFAAFVHGIDTTSLATSCVAAGFTHLAGDAVHKRIDAIEHAYRYEPVDLFAHVAKSIR